MVTESPSQPAISASEDTQGVANELPSYRAITPLAVWSLIFGLVSILGFAWEGFWSLPVVSIVLGLLALRKTKKYPEMYTGAGIARAGVALATIFGIASFTTDKVQGLVRTQQAEKFIKSYIKVLSERGVDEAFWYFRPPEFRKIDAQTAFKDFMKSTETDATTRTQKFVLWIGCMGV